MDISSKQQRRERIMRYPHMLFVAWLLYQANVVYTKSYWDYVVIGAGPGGLQMGHFLQKANRDYIIFERSNTSGSFFTKYPRHDKLISINKRHTGRTNKEFNMRHDWNSLLSDDESLLMRHYSKDFFPHREVMVKYLQDYQRKVDLNVKFNTNVSNIRRKWNSTTKQHSFYMDDQNGNIYTCRTLILATGIAIPNTPAFPFNHLMEGYESMSVDPMDYEGKTVLILGGGNSAFETADAIYGHTNAVHIASRSRIRLSWETHYVGDVRGVNNAVLDSYQLKSLDAIANGDIEGTEIIQKDGRLIMSEDSAEDNDALREPYDKIIRCLGFVFDRSIFNSSCKPAKHKLRLSKYPRIRFNHEVANIPGMFVAGTASHSIDHRKSAGGFIHGFRYTVRSLHHMLEWRNHRIPWPAKILTADQLLASMIKRINEASGTYQMFSVLGDLYNIKSNGDIEQMEEIPIDLLHQFDKIGGRNLERIFVVVMQYGANYSGPGKDVFREDRVEGGVSLAHRSNFLHPVIYYYETLPTDAAMKKRSKPWVLPRPDRIMHIVEDFLTDWTAPVSHILPLRNFLGACLGKDLRQFHSSSCFEMALSHKTVPESCNRNFLNGNGLLDSQNIVPLSSLSMGNLL